MSFGKKRDTADGGDVTASSVPSTPERPPEQTTAAQPDQTTTDPKSDDAGTPPKLSDVELQLAPQYVKDAAARNGGAVVRAAPKGGEGSLGRAVESAYPELEPPTAPAEYRAAPTAPGELPERDSWGDGARLTLKDVAEAGSVVEVRTRDPRSAGVYAGGVRILPDASDVDVDLVRARSAEHLIQLLTDPRVEVRVKPAAK